ncbi:alpha-ketoacid dehydrogenase subunit beta [Streptomyces sp. R39]|uniref:Alpha-ketoacid dehydrogenase subunit beta n=1 Tax=Streptomyces sp. R39 TaxID=3238631 RepID=A0AB39QZD6_9ACTN
MPEIRKLTYAEAVNTALQRALRTYPEALLFGEDVALPGGVFGVTKNLHRTFGDRVFDTPISESAILGGAVGAAMVGRRPIVEIMWVDFSLVALDQLINQAANVRYVSQGALSAPLTVRTQQGNAPGACAQHSQNLEALFAHVPGLRVCIPATPQDAHDLLLTSVASDDPVIVIENRTLYHQGKTEVAVDGPVQPLGTAVVRRKGSDITVVTWGAIQSRVLAAADRLQADGMSAEVIDLRWIRPHDIDAVLASVAGTGRLAVVHEAHTTAGFGAEIVAGVVESGIPLAAPPIRVGAPDARIPAAVGLAQALIPSTDRITEALAAAVRGRPGTKEQ